TEVSSTGAICPARCRGGSALRLDAAGARSRTTRIRVPADSTSSSARSWRAASSTMSLTENDTPCARPSTGRLRLGTELSRRRDAAQVLAAAGVDLHDVALVQKQRHLDHGPGLECRRLRAARCRVAANARLGLHDLELDEVGELDGHRALVDEEDLDLGILLEEIASVPDLLRVERDLVVGIEIHEMVPVVAVEELHPLLVEVDELHLLAGPERVVDDPAELHVLELGPDESAALAGFHLLEVDNAVRL